MVDLPQPLGPTIAANCPLATVRSTSSRARTGLAPPNTLVTPDSSMAFGMLVASICSADMAQAQQPVLQRDQQAVGEEAENADRSHVGDHDVKDRKSTRLNSSNSCGT